MVMAFNFKCYRKAIPDIDKPGILITGTDKQAAAASWELLQFRDGIFIATMLAPHDTEYSKLCEIGWSAKNFDDAVILILRKAMSKRNLHIYFRFIELHDHLRGHS